MEPPATGVADPLPGQVMLGAHEWPFEPDGPAEGGSGERPSQQPQPNPDLASNEEENFASTLDMEAIKVRLAVWLVKVALKK